MSNRYELLSYDSSTHAIDEMVAFESKSKPYIDNTCIDVLSFSCSLTGKNSSSSQMEINPLISTTTPSSFTSSSAAAIKKRPHCVSLKKVSLTRRGYKSFEEWNSDPNHLYIGRDMTHYIPGALGSKWGNPFKAHKNNKKSINKCLKRYEDHIRRNPDLFNAVMELDLC